MNELFFSVYFFFFLIRGTQTNEYVFQSRIFLSSLFFLSSIQYLLCVYTRILRGPGHVMLFMSVYARTNTAHTIFYVIHEFMIIIQQQNHRNDH